MKWLPSGSKSGSPASMASARDDLSMLISLQLDGNLDAEGQTRLGEILESDSRARLLYMQYIDLQIELSCQIDAADQEDDVSRQDNIIHLPPQNVHPPDAPLPYHERPLNKPTSHRGHWWGAVAAAAVVSAGIHFWLLQTKPESDDLLPGGSQTSETGPPVLGSLGEIAGDVNVMSADGQPRLIAGKADIHPGDTIHTLGLNSSAGFSYPDGTTITLSGDTSLTFLESEAKALAMPRGHLRADVAPQPVGKPMFVQTPLARIHVIGTVYTLEAQAGLTRLTVKEGVVRLTHEVDGTSVEVPMGKYVIADGFNALEVADIPASRVTWDSDFEKGLPRGWAGTTVTAGLPGGSKGGARAVKGKSPEDPSAPARYRISTPPAGTNGLFKIDPESHLRLRLRMDRPELLELRIVTRKVGEKGEDGSDVSTSHSYTLPGSLRWESMKPGDWYSITIPLSAFSRETQGTGPGESLAPGQIPVQLSLSGSSVLDPGLVIDRLWITAQGPGQIEIKSQD